MLDRGFNAPQRPVPGRLFDAVASLVGVRDRVSFEGQAALRLGVAGGDADRGPYSFEIGNGFTPPRRRVPAVVDTRPVIRAVVQDVQSRGRDSANRAAVPFHHRGDHRRDLLRHPQGNRIEASF